MIGLLAVYTYIAGNVAVAVVIGRHQCGSIRKWWNS